mmetsp:Transcript_22099/g.77463  ORF Transcript_22099/g.77463 Transcript_22099/m.77463 type:complete len:89 (+) Transcript_22099:58-324(+)
MSGARRASREEAAAAAPTDRSIDRAGATAVCGVVSHATPGCRRGGDRATADRHCIYLNFVAGAAAWARVVERAAGRRPHHHGRDDSNL